jgi:membrane associated rhomboid family serine protease
MTRPAWLVAILPAALLILALLLPDAAQAWAEYDRAALIRGEWWRLWTAHWVHADAGHALGGAGAWLCLARLSRSPVRMTAALTLVIAPLLSAALFWLPECLPPGLTAPMANHYRGTSGLLFVWLAYLLCAPSAAQVRLGSLLRVALAGLLMAKLAWDLTHWLNLHLHDGYAVAGEMHALGALFGMAWALCVTATSVQGKVAAGGAYNRG